MTESGKTDPERIDKKEMHSFGERLFVAREKQGLTIADIAKAIHLSENIIDALERSDVERLPQPTFVQGYLRTYAKYLGLSEAAILEEYSRIVPHSLETDLRPRSQLPDEAHSGSPFIKAITIVLLILVVIATIYGLYSYYSKKVDSRNIAEENVTLENSDSGSAILALPERDSTIEDQSTQSQGAETGVTEIETDAAGEPQTRMGDALPTYVDAMPDSGILSETKVVDEDILQAETADALIQAEEVETHPIAAGEDSVELIAQEDSWAEVVDANDVALLYDLVQQGHTVVLRGTAPFDIFLGNAPAMEVRVNGIQIDMTKFVRSNKIAHFNVSTDDQQVVFH